MTSRRSCPSSIDRPLYASASCPSVLLTNARSVFPKLDELRILADVLRADVIAITESWLHEGLTDDLLRVQNRDIFRSDRGIRKGGGVCVWANYKLLPHVIQPVLTVPSTIESIFLRLSCGCFSILFCVIYVPPGLGKDAHAQIVDF